MAATSEYSWKFVSSLEPARRDGTTRIEIPLFGWKLYPPGYGISTGIPDCRLLAVAGVSTDVSSLQVPQSAEPAATPSEIVALDNSEALTKYQREE